MSTKRILIVEDDELTLKALDFRLRKEGYETVVANNGLIAMEELKNNPPHLLITDLMLPFVNGLELIEYAKNQSKANISVIVLSAVNQEKTVLNAFKIGADDFISKPFSPMELAVRVKRLLLKYD